MVIDDHSPDAIEEASHAIDTGHTPGFRSLQRSHEHLVQPQGIGAVFLDHLVRVHHVTAALGHFVRPALNANVRLLLVHEYVAAFFHHVRLNPVTRHGLAGTLDQRTSVSGFDYFGRPDQSTRCRTIGRELGFPQDDALVNQSLERFRRTDISVVEQDLVPEAGIQQVQHRVLRSADVQIDRHPSLFFDRVDESGVVVGVNKAEVVPARSGPLRHRVGFALVAPPVQGYVQPRLGSSVQRRLGSAMWSVLLQVRKIDGQILDGNRTQQPGRLTFCIQLVEDGKRLAPESLAAEQPVTQLVVRRRTPQSLRGKVVGDSLLELVGRQAVVGTRVNGGTFADKARIASQHPRPIAVRPLAGIDHGHNRKVELRANS